LPLFFVEVVIAIVLLLIFIEDMKERAVHSYLFFVLAILLFFTRLFTLPYHDVLLSWSINILFILIQIGGVLLYFLFKEKKITNITRSKLGWGDICFWVAAAFYFSPLSFIVYFLLSIVISLTFHLIFRNLSTYPHSASIPLAGYQSLILLLLICGSRFWPIYLFNDDEVILEIILAL
jgi:hypothetical protein